MNAVFPFAFLLFLPLCSSCPPLRPTTSPQPHNVLVDSRAEKVNGEIQAAINSPPLHCYEGSGVSRTRPAMKSNNAKVSFRGVIV